MTEDTKNKTLTFEEDLWDQLPKIHTYKNQSTTLLNSLKQFSQIYTKTFQQFANGLRSCSQILASAITHPENPEEIHNTLEAKIGKMMIGLESLAIEIEEKTNQASQDTLEPIEIYIQQYSTSSTIQLSTAQAVFIQYSDLYNKVQDSKEIYFSQKENSEKADLKIEESMLAFERQEIDVERIQEINQQSILVKYKAELASQAYLKNVNLLNQLFKEQFTQGYLPALQKLQQIEEARISFCKSTIGKFIGALGQVTPLLINTASTLSQDVQSISLDDTLSKFIQSVRSEIIPPQEALVEQYKPSPELLKFKQELAARQYLHAADIQSEKVDNEGSPEEKVRKLLYQMILEAKPASQIEKEYLIRSVKLPEVRSQVADFFTAFTQPRKIQLKDCFATLGVVCRAILDILEVEHTEGLRELYSIMVVSQMLFYVENGRRTLFSTELDKHQIWLNSEIWKVCLSRVINLKFQDALQNLEKQKIEEEKKAQREKESGLFGLFNKVKNEVTKIGQQDKQQENVKQTTLRISKTLAQNIVFNCQSQFIGYFVSLRLSFDQSRELMLFFCKKYELDQSRTHLLLAELENGQRNQNYQITSTDLKNISAARKIKRNARFGVYIVIGLAIPYISTDSCLGKLLRLNKASHKALHMTVFQHALLYCQLEKLTSKRNEIWINILGIRSLDADYNQLKAEVSLNRELIANVDEVIMLDVSRSEHQMPSVDPQVLLSVLRTYALYNPKVEYCQGMNYVAGLLIMVFKDPEIAFKCLVTVVQRFGIGDLFNQELPKLKTFFYQMDRLVGLVDDDLQNHLKEEGLSSTLFASAWFITIFTSSLKKNTENEIVNESLLQLWDYFLIKGWRAIIKLSVYVLTSNSEKLKAMPFEDILPVLNDCAKDVLVQNRGSDQNLYLQIRNTFNPLKFSFHISKLAKEFDESHQEVNLQPVKNKQISLQLIAKKI